MTSAITFSPPPGTETVLTHAPMIRAFGTVADDQAAHGGLALTKSGAWNRHAIEWIVRQICFPNWTAEKLYSTNRLLNEFDLPPLEYLLGRLVALRLGRRSKDK